MKYYAPINCITPLTVSLWTGKPSDSDILNNLYRMICMDEGMDAVEAMEEAFQSEPLRPLSPKDGQALMVYNTDALWTYLKDKHIYPRNYLPEKVEIPEEVALAEIKKCGLRDFKEKELHIAV